LWCSRAVVSWWRSARGTAERNRAAALGFWVAAVAVWYARGWSRGLIKDGAGIWACMPRLESRRRLRD